MGSKIVSIEYVFPEKELKNEELAKMFPEYDFKNFEEKVGIKTRFVASEDETALDLAEKACNKLFENIDKNIIDYILFCTQSPDYILPTTACILQDRLGLRKNLGALDFNLGCSGFVYGVSLAKGLINSNQASNVLLVTAETYSKFLNPKDRSNRAIFGDAAAATLISYSDEEELGTFRFGTDGSGYDKLIIKNGGSRNNVDSNPILNEYGTNNFYTANQLYMDGPAIFNFTINQIPSFAEELSEANNVEAKDISQYVFHQANAFMLNFLRKKMKIEKEKFYINLKGGNTVSCTIPIALKDYAQTIDRGHSREVLIVGFGVGLSWAGGLIKLNGKL